MLNLVLWLAGIGLVAIAIWNIRLPFARLSELDRLAENAKRYESWRGGRANDDDQETTGADVMRQMMRRQVYVWASLGVAGVVLIVIGFVVR